MMELQFSIHVDPIVASQYHVILERATLRIAETSAAFSISGWRHHAKAELAFIGLLVHWMLLPFGV